MKKLIISAILLLQIAAHSFGDAPRTIELFNGKNLDGWKFKLDGDSANPEEVFGVKNGVIHIKGKPFGYMYTEEKYSNFRLHVEWMYPIERNNSGIFLFVQEPAAVWPNAIECQLCKDKAGDFVLLGGSDLKEYKAPDGGARPKFPVVKRFADGGENGVGQWNCADIICRDGKIDVYINGMHQNSATLPSNKSGHIGLQSEGADILFRNVRLTPIP